MVIDKFITKYEIRRGISDFSKSEFYGCSIQENNEYVSFGYHCDSISSDSNSETPIGLFTDEFDEKCLRSVNYYKKLISDLKVVGYIYDIHKWDYFTSDNKHFYFVNEYEDEAIVINEIIFYNHRQLEDYIKLFVKIDRFNDLLSSDFGLEEGTDYDFSHESRYYCVTTDGMFFRVNPLEIKVKEFQIHPDIIESQFTEMVKEVFEERYINYVRAKNLAEIFGNQNQEKS